MNKTYKTVWNQSIGEWVAVSEVAKSQGKKKALSCCILAAGLVMLANAGSVQAYTEITGSQTTQQSSTDTVTYVHDATINTTIDMYSVHVQSTTTADVTVENVNVQSSNSNGQIQAVNSYTITGHQGVNVKFKGVNDIELDAATGNTAVVAATTGGAGNVTIDVTGVLNIDNKANWRATENDGLEANANNGTSTITHQGTGKIQTAGGNAVFARAIGSTGDAVVTLQGSGGVNSIELQTSGGTVSSVLAGNHGISAAITNAANTTGQVLVTTDAKITTTKNYASAIRAESQGGTVDIKNDGTLTTSGMGSIGIYTISAAGNNSIRNTGDITTAGMYAHGIYADSANGIISIENTKTVTTSGTGAYGIYAVNAGSELTEIKNTGTIYTQNTNTGTMSAAIYAKNTSTGASDGIAISQEGGELKTHSHGAHGIYTLSTATSGDLNVIVKDTDITLTESWGSGIGIYNNSVGISDVDINITTIGGSIDVFDGSVASTTASVASYGIIARQSNGARGDINIQNIGTSITTGKNSDGTGNSSDAIVAQYSTSGTNNATGNISIYNEGVLTTYDGDSKGILIIHTGLGNVTVKNHGQITTKGHDSYGIRSNITNTASIGITQILNTGAITTAGLNANAIHVNSAGTGYAGEAIIIINTGDLNTADARGIYARSASGNVTVSNTGNITTAQATATTHSHGIDVSSLTGKADVFYDRGTIQVSGNTASGGNAIGIASWDANSGNAAQESSITLGSQAIIDATRGVGGLQIRTNGIGQINIARDAEVHGGSSYGIQMQGTGSAAGTYEINNSGIIDSVNDRAILTGGQAGSTLTVNNYGTITGYIDSATTQVIFNNYSNESLNLRNYYDSDADGIRDTKAVSVSTFGGGTFNNAATGAVRLLAVNGETTTITTGEHVPTGALSTATSGIVQGQLLNLATFNNAGEIDLTAGGQAGDVLVLSGGATAGTYGGGQYISNGGSLKLDSVLTIKNQGTGAYISQSDILVVDDARLGSASTKIYVTPVAISGYQSAITQNDGIQVVEVLGTSDTGAFALGAPVTYGAYEYILGQGTGINAQNWYLRNNLNGQAYYSPDAGAYLGNQYAAATMFNQNILDRRDNVLSPDRTLWARVNYSDMSSDLFSGNHDLDIDTTLIQIGADLYKNESVVAGLYAGYGHSNIDNKSNLTGSKASGKVDGYQIGAYGSWMPQGDNTGFYADVWGHYAWYDNKLTSAGYYRSDYDSTGYALSVETGYTYQFAQQTNGNAWLIEPHTQITYTSIDADNFTDQAGTRFSSNKGSGIQTRLGARLYNQRPAGQYGVNPFIEANWLYNDMDNSIRLNGQTLDAEIGKNVGEVKVGLQGEISKRVSVWGHVGGQAGTQGYKRYELQLGLGVQW